MKSGDGMWVKGVWRCLCRVLPWLWLGGLVTGCAPSTWLARQMMTPPNRVPESVKPEARVVLRWPEGILEAMPTGILEVGAEGVGLRWVKVEPGDYGFGVSGGALMGHPERADYSFTMRLPEVGADGEGEGREVRGTAFLVHGYGVDLESLFPWAVYLAEAGWRVVLVDLRGHGRSGGDRVTFGIREAEELCEFRRKLELAGEVHGPYVALGHSLGGTVVLRWQAMDPEVVTGVAWGGYAEFVPAAERLRSEYACWLPRCWVRRAAGRVPGLLGVPAEAMDPVSVVQGRELRVLYVAATGDRVTPPEDSQQLLGASGSGGRLLVVDGVTHETLPYGFEQHGEWVRKWLAGEW